MDCREKVKSKLGFIRFGCTYYIIFFYFDVYLNPSIISYNNILELQQVPTTILVA
jgi:hypothetical protein